MIRWKDEAWGLMTWTPHLFLSLVAPLVTYSLPPSLHNRIELLQTLNLQEQAAAMYVTDSTSSSPVQSDVGEEPCSAPGHGSGRATSNASSKHRGDHQGESTRLGSEQSRKRKREQELKLRSDVLHCYDLVENATDLMSQHTLDLEATFVFANTAWTRVFGVQTESLLDTSLVAIAHPRHQSFVKKQLLAVCVTRMVNTFEFTMVIGQQAAVVECSIRAATEHLVAISRIRTVAPLEEEQSLPGPTPLINTSAGDCPEETGVAGLITSVATHTTASTTKSTERISYSVQL